MNSLKETGNNGEQVARNYLAKKGYKICRTNYRFKNKEIDIIAEDNSFIVFIEVKTATGTQQFLEEQPVSKRQQKNLLAAAEYYIISNDVDKEARFDIILITNSNTVTHIESAFSTI